MEKQEIGRSVMELFEEIPELSQIYTHGRGAVNDMDERLVLTFRCPKEMLTFPFEFISSISNVDEGQVHLALTHPIRKTVLNIRCRKQPIPPGFFAEPNVRVLLVCSNVSGEFTIARKRYAVPDIPNSETEVATLTTLFDTMRTRNGSLTVDVETNPSCDEMADLIESGGYDVVHFSGHGFYADSPEDSCLLFRGANGIERLSAGRLNSLVNRSKIRLFYLSCCEGAAAGTADELLS